MWCICGHKELACGWTSNCKKLDKFIRKSQMLSKTANDAYLQCQTSPDEYIHYLDKSLAYRKILITQNYTNN